MAGYGILVHARAFHHPVWLLGDWLVSVCIAPLRGGAVGGCIRRVVRLPPDRGSKGSSRGGTLLGADLAAPCGPPSRRNF